MSIYLHIIDNTLIAVRQKELAKVVMIYSCVFEEPQLIQFGPAFKSQFFVIELNFWVKSNVGVLRFYSIVVVDRNVSNFECQEHLNVGVDIWYVVVMDFVNE